MATAVVQTRSSSRAGGGDLGERSAARPRFEPPVGPTHTANGRPIDDFLQTLARAIHQFHTYPATSPQCVEAVAETHSSLNQIDADALVAVVRPRELVVDGHAIGRDTPVEHELARRLYAARCATITIARSAANRELARLCIELAARRARGANRGSLDERLRSHGVERITVSAAYEPVLLDIETTPASCAAVEQRHESHAELPTARVAHLYPPDKGWVRVDPGVALRSVSLSGLARLVEDPAALAVMLARLDGDASDPPSCPADALERRCEDVARLYTGLDPAVARTRFARLASAVLTLDSSRRRRLLANKVLPGLVDGRPEGDLLRDFPDVDLADALSLLLDVETAAPELLTAALDRLHLSPERHDAIAPLLQDRIRARNGSNGVRDDVVLQERTRQLIQIANGTASFHDFAAYDLRTDEATERVIAGTNESIRATNIAGAQLGCVTQLLALDVNADSIDGLLKQVTRLLDDLERTQSIAEFAARMEALQRVGATLRQVRPNAATSLAGALESFYTPPRFERLVTMYEAGGERRELANRIVTAIGSSLTSAVVRNLDGRTGDKRVLHLVIEHAATFAPALGKMLDELPVPQRIAAMTALSTAGRGQEHHIARQLTHQNEGVVREALAALTRIGSEEAAEFVTRHVQRSAASQAHGAEQLLWQFAPPLTRHCLRTLLRQRQFVVAHPALIQRLLDRMDRSEAVVLVDVLRPLVSLRLRFWNRSLARVGRQAAALLNR